MFSQVFRIAIVAGALAAGVFATQSSTEAADANVGYVAVGNRTLVPYGWVDFCNRYRGECDASAVEAQDVRLTAVTEKIIKRVNGWVNSNIKPKSDDAHWGQVDRWDYPSDGLGDCEDYALLKRRLLIQEGFPRQALLITVVKDEQGDGHAVLTVKTDKGDFILDNLHDRVLAWSKVPYRFVKRQSQTQQNVWVEIGEPTAAPLTVSR